MLLELKAKHFKKSDYFDNSRCPIANAYKELTGNNSMVGTFDIDDSKTGESYDFEVYGYDTYIEDNLIALENKFDETVIRTIELTKTE